MKSFLWSLKLHLQFVYWETDCMFYLRRNAGDWWVKAFRVICSILSTTNFVVSVFNKNCLAFQFAIERTAALGGGSEQELNQGRRWGSLRPEAALFENRHHPRLKHGMFPSQLVVLLAVLVWSALQTHKAVVNAYSDRHISLNRQISRK